MIMNAIKEGEICMASFKEEDIVAGKQVSKDLKLKQLVNRTGGVKGSGNC